MARSNSSKPDPSVERWWFNLRTGKTEFGLQSRSLDRVGPFDSEAEASNAPKLIAERAAKWEKSEREES